MRALVTAGVLMMAAALGPSASAHGITPEDTPVERIVTNLESYIKAHPDDAEGYYRLGRTHFLAYSTDRDAVLAYREQEDKGGFRPADGSWAKRDWGRKGGAALTPEAKRAHLEGAIRNLNKAIELRPDEAKFRLTLACTLEAGAGLKRSIDAHPLSGPSDGREITPRPEWYVDKEIEKCLKLGVLTDELRRLVVGSEWGGADPETRYYIVARLSSRRNDPNAAFVRELLDADWDRQVLDQFFLAMCLALPGDSDVREKPVWGGLEDYVAYEAGQCFIRVVKERDDASKNKMRLTLAKATVKAFDDLPRPNAVTPIVVSMTRPEGGLMDLVCDDAVAFDLDGSGAAQRWSWVKPETGILCWDPRGTGKVTSGYQLFGSVSYRLFFDDGYQALDLLDDDRDGALSGSELKGISVWFDRDGDGVSDPGEVVAVVALGVVSISCRATGVDAGCAANLEGLTLSDGTTLPTFDWVATRRDQGGTR